MDIVRKKEKKIPCTKGPAQRAPFVLMYPLQKRHLWKSMFARYLGKAIESAYTFLNNGRGSRIVSARFDIRYRAFCGAPEANVPTKPFQEPTDPVEADGGWGSCDLCHREQHS